MYINWDFKSFQNFRGSVLITFDDPLKRVYQNYWNATPQALVLKDGCCYCRWIIEQKRCFVCDLLLSVCRWTVNSWFCPFILVVEMSPPFFLFWHLTQLLHSTHLQIAVCVLQTACNEVQWYLVRGFSNISNFMAISASDIFIIAAFVDMSDDIRDCIIAIGCCNSYPRMVASSVVSASLLHKGLLTFGTYVTRSIATVLGIAFSSSVMAWSLTQLMGYKMDSHDWSFFIRSPRSDFCGFIRSWA